MFECSKCNKSFSNKFSLNRHLKKKIPCIKVFNCHICNLTFESDIKQLEHSKNVHKGKYKQKKQHLCMYCDMELTTNSNKHKHESICKLKDVYTDIKSIDKFKKFMNIPDDTGSSKLCINNDSHDKTINVVNNTNHSNNSVSLTNNNTVINNFGEENLDYLTLDDRMAFYKDLKKGFIDLMHETHFGKTENMNFFIKNTNKNLSKSISMVKKDGLWKIDTLSSILDAAFFNSRSKFCKMVNSDSDFVESYDNTLLTQLKYMVDKDMPNKKTSNKKHKYPMYNEAMSVMQAGAFVSNSDARDAFKKDCETKKLMKNMDIDGCDTIISDSQNDSPTNSPTDPSSDSQNDSPIDSLNDSPISA